jgi:hypothetical protein
MLSVQDSGRPFQARGARHVVAQMRMVLAEGCRGSINRAPTAFGQTPQISDAYHQARCMLTSGPFHATLKWASR